MVYDVTTSQKQPLYSSSSYSEPRDLFQVAISMASPHILPHLELADAIWKNLLLLL